MKSSKPSQSLIDLFTAYTEGTATPAQVAELERLIATDPAHRAQYLTCTLIRTALIERTRTAKPTPAPNPAVPTSAAGVPMYRKGCEPQPFKLRAHHYGLAAAALLAACGLAAYLLTTSVDPELSPPESSSPPPVATLIHNTGDLRTPHGYPAEGDDYGRGEYTLSSGIAEFMLTNAVNVKLRGKTRMHMRNDMNVSMTRGSAEFAVPKDATGFAVALPDGTRIIDLGTRFRVNIDAAGNTLVRVTEGSVAMTSIRDDHAPIVTEFARVVDGRIEPLTDREYRELDAWAPAIEGDARYLVDPTPAASTKRDAPIRVVLEQPNFTFDEPVAVNVVDPPSGAKFKGTSLNRREARFPVGRTVHVYTLRSRRLPGQSQPFEATVRFPGRIVAMFTDKDAVAPLLAMVHSSKEPLAATRGALNVNDRVVVSDDRHTLDLHLEGRPPYGDTLVVFVEPEAP